MVRSSSDDRPIYPGFKSGEVSKQEIMDKITNDSHTRIFTGVRLIDDVWGGILKNDIVLLGAKTGVGKTELASQIALNNTLIDKNVYMFALEAEHNEIQMRILYSIMVEKAKIHNPRAKYNFKHWRLGKYRDLNSYYDDALEQVNHFKNFNIFYRSGDFGITEFVRETMAVKEKADLIIVDHIHYFDLDGKDQNKELSDAIKKIRDVALLTGVPMIVLAHLRKSANVQYKLVPDLDDFHGSSDLTKVCTKGLIISPGPTDGDRLAQTLFFFPKFRGFSQPSRFLFKADYDIYQNRYLDTYNIYNFKYNNISFKFAENLVDPEEISWLGG
jgi:replicative DNA helicase